MPENHNRMNADSERREPEGRGQPDGPPMDCSQISWEKKKTSIFLTEKVTGQEEDVQRRHHELNQYIDNVNSKITQIVQKNEAEFLMAYRNHHQRVRKQMDAIKKKYMSKSNNSMGETERIDQLEKQLILFREESLKLFICMQQRDKIIEKMKIRTDELESETKFLSESVESLTKRNKYLQGARNYEQHRNLENVQVTNIHSKKQSKWTSNLSNRGYTSSSFGMEKFLKRSQKAVITSKRNTTSVQRSMEERSNTSLIEAVEKEVGQQNFQLIARIVDVITKKRNGCENEVRVSDKSIIFNHKRYSSGLSCHKTKNNNYLDNSMAKILSKSFVQKSEMEKFFISCIEIVRKEINRRKHSRTLNFYKQHSSMNFNDFKKVDSFRIMELVVSNENILRAIYSTIFQQQ